MHEPDLRTLPAMLAYHAARSPDAPFLTDESGALTYAEAVALAQRIGSGLARCGVRRGDHVAIMLDNRREFLATWLALAVMGAVEVPVNQQSVGERLIHLLNHSRCTTLVVQREYIDQVAAVGDRLTALRVLVVVGGDAAPSRFEVVPWADLDDGTELPPALVRFSDPVALMYTSGSTGPAKGAILSHGHHYMNGYQAVASVGITVEDRIYATTPLHHNMAQGYGVWPAIVAGAAVHVARRFDRHTFWTDVAAARATVLPFVGAMLVLLAKNPQTEHDAANPLRVGYGVPIPADLHRLFEKRFGMRLIHCYGSTEATIVAWGNDDDAVPGAVGRAFPGYEVRIHDDDDVPLPHGTVGQICVRPSEPYAMFSGYFDDPEKTALSLRNAWFHTGDRGWFDEEDRLWFSDRVGDAIRCKGENISAHEVEEAFLPHPGISLVAAYGIPAELGDEEVVIAVVPQPDTSIDPEELLEWAADRLGRYAMPRFVDIVDALPMTPTGKVEKYKLRERGRSPSAYDARAAAPGLHEPSTGAAR
jgi:crotonobetaine/carnitine-CoA ligase